MFRYVEARFSKYLTKYLSTRVIFLMDMFLSVVASAVVLTLINIFSHSNTFVGQFSAVWLVGSIVFSLFSFSLLKTHSIIIRHMSIRDILTFLGASAIKDILLAITIYVGPMMGFKYGLSDYLPSILIVDCLMTFAMLVVVRAAMIVTYGIVGKHVIETKDRKRVLVYGTSDKSVAMVVRLKNSRHFRVMGFVADQNRTRDLRLFDLPVHHIEDDEELSSICSRNQIEAVLFSRESDLRKESDGLVPIAVNQGLKLLIAPEIDEVGEDSENSVRSSIRDVKIEDLLGREEINISMSEIKKYFKGKTVMVTGAAGSIGSELCRQLAGFGVGKLVFYDNAETPMHNLRLEFDEKYPDIEYVPVIGDVRLPARLDFAFRTYRPQVLFHAAAYKHVPLMEENPCEAVLVNVVGSRNVADKCIEYGVEKMVMISTDKAVNPTNIMGCTKRLAEIYVQSLGLAIESGTHEGTTQFVTTRFGNVLGSNGSVIPRFRDQIAAGGPVTVTHPDINRFFMTIPEACRLVMEAATTQSGNRICVFDMGKPVKIDTLARRMIKLSGLKPDIDIKIEYTGLRPGEKLYEEVLSNVESTDPTSHDRIRLARVRDYDYNDAKVAVDRLEELSRAVEIPDMVKYMKEVVPEFISNNSKYSEYDKK